ncbi:hypothetical protein PS862_00866 [Pseudomonas fluorescens]|uniref:Uncharacterized protein n=1 Tax=Pseudomonas fluorescens TaxID=294 RepID=A0A5E7HDB2_PSEFL|nr:hypothetical protein PS862_00866 [Pseudomonas fluorescens]
MVTGAPPNVRMRAMRFPGEMAYLKSQHIFQ